MELTNPQVVPYKTLRNLATPPGYSTTKAQKVHVNNQAQEELDELKIKKAWEIATGPAKSLPMTLIMSYMSGNSLQIIPMTMTFMLLMNPIKAIVTDTNKVFQSLENDRIASQIAVAKLVFVVCQLLNLSVGVYKVYTMGLIPNKEIDWIDWKGSVGFLE